MTQIIYFKCHLNKYLFKVKNKSRSHMSNKIIRATVYLRKTTTPLATTKTGIKLHLSKNGRDRRTFSISISNGICICVKFICLPLYWLI